MTTIRFDNVSKKFRQRHAQAPDADLWALRDITFECQEGEALGLAGRNGCGKSTLLKLAANVTQPTFGTVSCASPVAPMLELGAGFHHDLTGRDNVHLNGSFLGLGRRVSPALLDEIVAFAEIEQHIDTPVKHYSSGMYARLAFAIAVHSPARVLLVDEVLQVGDALFRQKCIDRMKHLREGGTTVLLVSHESGSLRSFCNRVLVIDEGRAVAEGAPEEALQIYEQKLRGLGTGVAAGVSIVSLDLYDAGEGHLIWLSDGFLRARVAWRAEPGLASCSMTIRIRREDGVCCARCESPVPQGVGEGCLDVAIDGLSLTTGRYFAEIVIEDAASLKPLASRVSGMFQVPGEFDSLRGHDGVIAVRPRWSFH